MSDRNGLDAALCVILLLVAVYLLTMTIIHLSGIL